MNIYITNPGQVQTRFQRVRSDLLFSKARSVLHKINIILPSISLAEYVYIRRINNFVAPYNNCIEFVQLRGVELPDYEPPVVLRRNCLALMAASILRVIMSRKGGYRMHTRCAWEQNKWIIETTVKFLLENNNSNLTIGWLLWLKNNSEIWNNRESMMHLVLS